MRKILLGFHRDKKYDYQGQFINDMLYIKECQTNQYLRSSFRWERPRIW